MAGKDGHQGGVGCGTTGLGWDEQHVWGGRKGTGHSGTRRAGAAWVVRDGAKRSGTGEVGQDGAQRNKAGRASVAGGVGQMASEQGEAAT